MIHCTATGHINTWWLLTFLASYSMAHSHAPSLLASVASWDETLWGTQWPMILLLEYRCPFYLLSNAWCFLCGHHVGTWSCFPSPSTTTVPPLMALKTLLLMLFSSSVLPLKCPSPTWSRSQLSSGTLSHALVSWRANRLWNFFLMVTSIQVHIVSRHSA